MMDEQQSQQKRKLSLLWARMAQNIDSDYLEAFLITSQAAGLEPSAGRSFGAGKSTLGLTIVYRAFAYENGTLYIDWDKQLIIDETPEDKQFELMKKVIDNYVFWSLSDLLKAVKTASKRLPAVLWDDVQLDCPSWQNIPKNMREMIEELTVVRPLISNIVMTTPSISDIAKPLRRLVNWEVIIPDRAIYEVHFVSKKRNFYKPIEDMSRLWYDASGSFDKLPEEVLNLYKKRREEISREMKRVRSETKSMLDGKESFKEKVLKFYEAGYPPSTIAGFFRCKTEDIQRVLREMGH